MIYIMSGAYKMSEKPARRLPEIGGLIALIKPITWFPPMWAYLCGLVSSGQPLAAHWVLAVLGLLLAGPIVCGMSQAANDWADRHVDAINEPNRPIPSGRVTEGWGLGVAVAMARQLPAIFFGCVSCGEVTMGGETRNPPFAHVRYSQTSPHHPR